MSNLTETSTFDAGVYQLALTDIVQGGPGGVSNMPQQNLANRTRWLYNNTLPLTAGASWAMTGPIYGLNAEFARIIADQGVISGYRADGLVRTGYLQFGNLSGAISIVAEGASMAFSVLTGGAERWRTTATGQVLFGATTSLTGSNVEVTGTLGLAMTTGTVSGIVGVSSQADFFTADTNKRIHNYGLTWKQFSDALSGPSAALSGFGGIRLFTGSTERLRIDVNGLVGLAGPSSGARLDINGSTAGAQQVVLTRGASDTNFQLTAFNGAGSTPSSEHARFGLQYAGVGMAAGLSFLRGGTTTDGTLAFVTSNAAQAFIDASGNAGFGGLSPGEKVYVAGAIRSTVGLNLSTGSVYTSTNVLAMVATLGNGLWLGANNVATIQVDATGGHVGIASAPGAAALTVGGDITSSTNLNIAAGSINWR